MATLKQVAERAGVSTATVSKVLSNTPYFTEETRYKVMQAVTELGYIPNLAARALTSGRTHIIAAVFPYVFDAVFTDPFVEAILEGVESFCSEHGYNLLLSTPRLSAQGPDKNYMRLMRSGYLDGIVALDNVPIASVIKPAVENAIPAVAVGYDHHTQYVMSDDFEGSKKLMAYLVSLGHRQIGIISCDTQLNYPIQQRLAGMRQVAHAVGIDFDALPIVQGDFSIEQGAMRARELLQEYPTLTALIGINDRTAIGAMQAVQALGYRVPQDITIVGYDNIPLTMLVNPDLTTIDQRAPLLGKLAAEMLFKLINDDEAPSSIRLQPDLIVRESAGIPREKSTL